MVSGADSSSFQSTPSVWRETRHPSKHVPRHFYFNPLPPYGGRRHPAKHTKNLSKFQSTPSVWRETKKIRKSRTGKSNFNPLPPYGGRLEKLNTVIDSKTFQSTPSVWRETERNNYGNLKTGHFNPLPPYGGRPVVPVRDASSFLISIHSLRMEGDHVTVTVSSPSAQFQSTPSVWRETSTPGLPSTGT